MPESLAVWWLRLMMRAKPRRRERGVSDPGCYEHFLDVVARKLTKLINCPSLPNSIGPQNTISLHLETWPHHIAWHASTTNTISFYCTESL